MASRPPQRYILATRLECMQIVACARGGWEQKIPDRILIKFYTCVGTLDVIAQADFSDHRLKGFGGKREFPLSIDSRCRP